MDFNLVEQLGQDTVVYSVRHFSLSAILDCGQSFRWERLGENAWHGVAFGKYVEIIEQEDTLIFRNTTLNDFHGIWKAYFDLDRDYGAVKALLYADPVMARAVDYSPGMRMMRQEPWETLCSFIISANNNITRIKGIIKRLCTLFGEELADGQFAFPTPERMAVLSPEELEPLRCGYRVGYLLDAAKKVASGEILLPPVYTLPIEAARTELQKIKGVGPKVADCVLLYGFARVECVPVDVWIRRALAVYYPQGIPDVISEIAGLGQVYLFEYIRKCPEAMQTAV